MAEGSKTEKATPKKRKDERKKGNVFLSKDAVAVASLLGTLFAVKLVAGTAVNGMSAFLRTCLSAGEDPALLAEGGLSALTAQGLTVIAGSAGPIMAAAVLSSAAATFLQTRFLASGESLKPKFNRISPVQGFKRIFSLKSVIEALKGLLKIIILLVIIFLCLRDMFLESSKYLYTDLVPACGHLFDVAAGMAVKISIAFVALAAFDFLYQWWDFERQMRMSKQEVKEEYKQVEGDPQVKGKIRELQRRMAQTRMMQQVPQADVVIRNPTHIAVALRYRPETDNAPLVLAKGQDELAMRIVKTAQEHQVAMIENVPLARALYAQAELNREIPPELYGAVAEVLVYIFRLSGKQEIVD